MPLTSEENPKCYMCHKGFEDIKSLREHQKSAHDEPANDSKANMREPAPGDVTVF